MTGGKSRWAEDDEEDAQAVKREKETKKAAKIEKQRRLQAEAIKRAEEEEEQRRGQQDAHDGSDDRPAKRRRLSASGREEGPNGKDNDEATPLLQFVAPAWGPCRKVDIFERLNHIEEGSYGWVSRAKETATGEIIALKKLKMDNLNDGFPITALREIQTLKESRHPNIVDLREVVVGKTLDDVFLVMEFLEHDLKTLQEDMQEPFLPSEVKTLMLQITSAIEYLHDHWIIHRDLKTSNILLNNRGQIKLADFGMARHTSSPPPPHLTQLVVTLWYRAPELLLGTTTYGPEIDVWSLGCVFAELLKNEPLLQGKNEVDQLSKIFGACGIPTDKTWPSFRRLPNAKALRLPAKPRPDDSGSVLRARFPLLTTAGCELLAGLLALDPDARPTATQVLAHPYFTEAPRPKAESMFPTFPSKAGQERRRRRASPNAPIRGEAPKISGEELGGLFSATEEEEVGGGFALRMA